VITDNSCPSVILSETSNIITVEYCLGDVYKKERYVRKKEETCYAEDNRHNTKVDLLRGSKNFPISDSFKLLFM
jgi:hypothetical protein